MGGEKGGEKREDGSREGENIKGGERRGDEMGEKKL